MYWKSVRATTNYRRAAGAPPRYAIQPCQEDIASPFTSPDYTGAHE
jgi:hypothetical protein